MREIKVEDEKLEANQRSEAYLVRAGHPTVLHTSLPHAAAAMLPAANRILLPLAVQRPWAPTLADNQYRTDNNKQTNI